MDNNNRPRARQKNYQSGGSGVHKRGSGLGGGPVGSGSGGGSSSGGGPSRAALGGGGSLLIVIAIVVFNLLTGGTEEECRDQAKAIMAYAKPSGYPRVKDAGEVQHIGGGATRDKFKDWFESNFNY